MQRRMGWHRANARALNSYVRAGADIAALQHRADIETSEETIKRILCDAQRILESRKTPSTALRQHLETMRGSPCNVFTFYSFAADLGWTSHTSDS
jgi:hypothetical protein